MKENAIYGTRILIVSKEQKTSLPQKERERERERERDTMLS